MIVRVFLRVAEGARGPMVSASTRPNYKPLERAAGTWDAKPLPTAAFAIDLDIPDEAFIRSMDVLAKIEVPLDKIKVAAEVADA